MSAASLWQIALLLAFALPLVALMLVGLRRTRSCGVMVAPWAVAVGISLLLAPNLHYEIPSMLLGMHVGIDDTGRSFLIVVTVCWTAGAFFAQGYIHEKRESFWAFYLVTYLGNLGVVLSLDGITYLMSFALMSFSAYGLIVHDRSAGALRAGRVYLSMVLVGEVLIFAGAVFWAIGGQNFAAHMGQPLGMVPCLLLFLGFGIKAGVVPIHFWLPLAHPAAPAPASAVLSGALVKTGVLGWLRFLPLGTSHFPVFGDVLVAAGLFGMFFGVVLGLAQVKLKSILAYSTVSQIGLITASIGIALQSPSSSTLAVAAISLFVVHHGIAKTLLFLSAALADQASRARWLRTVYCIGVSWAAATLAGAPLTSGLLAKSAIKGALVSGSGSEATLPWLLFASSVGTALLMMRFLLRVLAPSDRRAEAGGARLRPTLWAPWALLLLISACLPWLWPHRFADDEWASASVVKAVAATGIGALAGLILMRGTSAKPRVAEGDIYAVFRALARRLASLFKPAVGAEGVSWRPPGTFWDYLARADTRLSSWASSITVILAIVVLFIALALALWR